MLVFPRTFPTQLSFPLRLIFNNYHQSNVVTKTKFATKLHCPLCKFDIRCISSLSLERRNVETKAKFTTKLQCAAKLLHTRYIFSEHWCMTVLKTDSSPASRIISSRLSELWSTPPVCSWAQFSIRSNSLQQIGVAD